MRISRLHVLLIVGALCVLLVWAMANYPARQGGLDEAGQIIQVESYDYTARDVSLPRGEILTISLRHGPSTGYYWEMTGASDSDILPLKLRVYVMDHPMSHMPGEAGYLKYIFQAKAKGATRLVFTHWPPVLQRGASAPKLTVRVTVDR